VLIEREVGHRPELANAALRLSMLAVFGPRVINEDKFTAWSTKLEVLGLSFDTERRTVTMPQRKIDKAILRVEAMGGQSKTTRIALRQLLGSLRHVCTCCRAMKPFFQRVQSLAIIAPPHGTIAMGSDVLQDLKWTASILRAGRFKDLPTAMFGAWPDPDVHLYMDASNAGLAVLDPAQRRFVRVKFDEAECDQIENPPEQHGLTINVREQLSVAIAALVWGKEWKQQHTITQVWCWVDNTTAVACANKLSSRNHLAQELNRAIGWSEAVNGFRIRCLHLPGRINRMADAASRAWSQPHTDVWNAMSQGWRSQEVPAELRKPYVPRSENYSAQVWPQAPGSSTTVVGSNGCSGRISKDGADGCQPTNLSTLIDSTYCWTKQPRGLGNTYATVLSKLCHLSWRHRLDRGYAVSLHQGHNMALQGMRRLSKGPTARAPATIPILRAVRSCCNLSSTHERVLWGAAIVGYFFLLRSAEYLHAESGISDNILTYDDVKCKDARGCESQRETAVVEVCVRLKGSKTDQEGRQVELALQRSGSSWLCPVRATLMLSQHGRECGIPPFRPLCSVSRNRVIRASELTKKLQQAATTVGVDPKRMGTHSLRSGGASAMMEAGVDGLVLRQFGRWKSDCVSRYTRLTSDTTRTLSARMAGHRTT